MKNTIFAFALLLFAGVAMQSCTKDKTYDERMTATWKSVDVVANGANVTSQIAFSLQLKSDKSFSLTIGVFNPVTNSFDNSTSTGHWQADETTMQLVLTYDANSSTETYTVVDLSDSTLKISGNIDSTPTTVTFAKQ